MWIHIAMFNNRLYQDGKEVKEIVLDGAICDIAIKGNDSVWIKIK